MSEKHSAATRALHAAHSVQKGIGEPLTPPLYLTSSFGFEHMADGLEVAQGNRKGYVYSRGQNPTLEAAESVVNVIEGAEASVVLASGMAAISTTVLALLNPGDHMLLSPAQYGGTYALAHGFGARFGLTHDFVDVSDEKAVEAAITPKTRALLVETVGNPTMVVARIDRLADICRGHDMLLLVDNTFASGALYRPLEHGASAVMNSATKYMNGHGDNLVGTVSASAETVQRVRELTSQLGGIASPFAAYLLWRGLVTLPIRVREHSERAQKVAEALVGEPGISRVLYPGLRDHKHSDWVHKNFTGAMAGGMMAIELDHRLSANTFLDHLELFQRAVSLGDTTSLAQTPITLTHRKLTEEEYQRSGITPWTIRISIGLEDAEDLISDLRHALSVARASI